MESVCKGIVIRATDYREKDKILDIFTPYGFVTVTAKGVRTPQAKLKSATSLLTYGEFSYLSGRTNILNGADVIESFFPCWNEPRRYAVAMLCLELTEKCFLKEEETHEELITLLKIITEISYNEKDPLYFALWYAVYCGMRTGLEVGDILDRDPDTAVLIGTVAADDRFAGVVGASERDFFVALKLLSVCFETSFDIKIKSLSPLLQLYLKT